MGLFRGGIGIWGDDKRMRRWLRRGRNPGYYYLGSRFMGAMAALLKVLYE